MTHQHLASMGQFNAEGFALWAGKSHGSTFRVYQTYVPKQTAIRAEHGVCVTVEADELHRLNRWLYKEGYELISQIHSHPAEAYHSDTDDTYPIVATVGAFSIVIPNFASSPFLWETCAVFRLFENGRWTELSQEEINKIFFVEE